jgi:hypothetical protein
MASDARIELREKDNMQGRVLTIWKEAAPGRDYAGDYRDLDHEDIEFNDCARSATLYGEPGTTVWLYNAKDFKRDEEVLEIKVPPGQAQVVMNNMNQMVHGSKWIEKHGGGIQGKVSGVQWK